ncbi:3-keto-5-aminohexanoate cleavage protein [Streptomyces sp. NPDC012888]|uniref:3-keto-5-aminohexanoate cleavage protein n=1 Tax=Streptomyces sp. NPDC012888 TaxID=3364855 RepID=UPI0036817BA1
MSPVVQVSLNGSRTGADSAAVPMSPAELVEAAVRAVAAGATEVLVHPRTPCGRESLSPRVVGPVVAALRAAAGVPVAVCATVGAEPDPAARLARVRSWEVLPDRAAVGWSEPGVPELTAALLERGVAVDAVLPYGGPAPVPHPAVRPVLLVGAGPGDRTWPGGRAGLRGGPGVWGGPGLRFRPGGGPYDAAARPDGGPADGGPAQGEPVDDGPREGGPVEASPLICGRDGAAWPAVRLAAELRAGVRTGVGDVLHLPDGRPARSSAELVAAALAFARSRSGG